MLFNSFSFMVFLAIVLLLYYSLEHKWQNRLLLAASYVFYCVWDWRFLGLIWFVTLVDYLAAPALERAITPGRRKAILAGAVAANLAVLGFFKYANFFVASFSQVLSLLGIRESLPVLRIILPVGISFYTFQGLGYVIDVYRRRQDAEHDLLTFALYIAYFPQLVAGPIERAQNLIPALRRNRTVRVGNMTAGAELMLIGYLKKVAIADAVAPYVNACFSNPENWRGLSLLLGLYLFALQIYGDFCGYSDIARGVSKVMGIDLMVNFRQPYFSSDIREFWRRWHISLSGWLRDYLYIPLGGSRHGTLATIRNLMLTMLLGGLWHGAAWHFVLWGGLHGFYLSIQRLLSGTHETPGNASRWKILKIAGTFHLVVFTWLFFRADTLADAVSYLGAMLHVLAPPSKQLLVVTPFYYLLMMAVDLPLYKSGLDVLPLNAERWLTRGLAHAAIVLLILFVGDTHAEPFIYFQF